MRPALRAPLRAAQLAARGAPQQQRAGLSYKAPLREIKFIMNDVLCMDDHYKTLPEYVAEECDKDFVNEVLQTTASLAEDVVFPLYQSGDSGCVHDPKDCSVTTPKGFKEAYHQYIEGGWQGLSVPKEYDGMGMPLSLTLLKNELLATANWSWFMYPGLSIGAMNTLIKFGDPWMKDQYLRKLGEGTWSGTMCLTEPQCGTDLGQVKTRAVPDGEDKFGKVYRITGTKIFISGGEHDYGGNIVQIVLAKLPDAPEGTRGISLFLVPKYLPKDGNVDDLETEQNSRCGSIESKMGIHGCSTSEILFENSKGWMIGEANKGLHYMFTFMNTARLGTGLQGLAHMELAFQNAVAYANERMSMRALSGAKDKDKVADAIVHHGDVRRMLLTAKALSEGSRSIIYECAKMADAMVYADEMGDAKLAESYENRMGLLTPVAKGCVTEWANEVTKDCQQVFGGHGYIKAHGMEQIVRDCRIASLYEGTTGIQGLDLLGRKVLLDRPKPMGLLNNWCGEVRAYCWKSIMSGPQQHRGHAWQCFKYVTKLQIGAVQVALQAQKNKDVVSCAGNDFLFFKGYVTLAYHWLRMGNVAAKKIGGATGEEERFLQAKLDTTAFYFGYLLPRAESHRRAMINGNREMMKIDRHSFNFLEPM